MTITRCRMHIPRGLMAAVLLGAAIAPVAAEAVPTTYEECVAKLFRTDACASTGWWSDSTCQMKTISECGLP